MQALNPLALSIAIAWLTLVAFLLIRAANQKGLLPTPSGNSTPESVPFISIIVPARNEEANIALCLGSLIRLKYAPDRFQIIVVDDSSTDRTVEIVRRFEAHSANVKLVIAPPLPSNWTGKAHACHVGANASDRRTQILCFIDADVEAYSTLLLRAVAMIETEAKRLVSLVPAHRLVTFPERLLIPCGFYALAFLGDLSRVEHTSDVRATGQFIMLPRDFYREIGGHAAVNTAICEDLALARNAQRLGGRVILADGSQLMSVRLYDGWHSLWLGLTKNLIDTLGGPRSAVIMAFAAPFLSWAGIILPAVYIWLYLKYGTVSYISVVITLMTGLSIFALHIRGARHFRIPIAYGFIFPLGYTIGSIIALDSLRRRHTGRLVWKGRIYR